MRNFFAAFADGAILFPLLAVLSVQSGFSGHVLLASAGVAYWVAGLFFRVPMSVQPLKSIAIAALALGATRLEISMSGAILGIIALGLVWFNPDRIADRVPLSLVHGLQLGLGILLVLQGLKFAAEPEVILVVVMLVISPLLLRTPLLGMVAFLGLCWALFAESSQPSPGIMSGGTSEKWIRPEMVLSLVLPQLALTLTNSVLGTRDVARRYYGAAADRVTARNLLISLGAGNILSSVFGGLPFCHGSGGLTAHARAGATHWISNGVIGSVLLLLAMVHALGHPMSLTYPPLLLAALLITVGIHHLCLAAPSWRIPSGRIKLLMMGIVALLTRNMLWTLVAGSVLEVFGGGYKHYDFLFKRT